MQCALGWACWKTYVGRPEADELLGMAMSIIGNGLFATGRHADALIVEEARLSTIQRLGASEDRILIVQSNLAISYEMCGRFDEALRMLRDAHTSSVRLYGTTHEYTLSSALNLSISLVKANNTSESMTLLRPLLPVARRVLGADHDISLRLAHSYVHAVVRCAASSRGDYAFAEKLLEDTVLRFRRVLGTGHPSTQKAETDLAAIREGLAELE